MSEDLAARLRKPRERRGWTVVDMAERTGIPKRTLDKYKLRSGASLPDLEALLALSKGLGVSLDWLVFGEELVGEGAELLSEMASENVSQTCFETLLNHHATGERPILDGEEILGLTPEEWAADLGCRVGEKFKELAGQGVTRQELLEWKHSAKGRLREILRDRFDRLAMVKTEHQ